MKKFIFICCMAVTTLLCSCSSKESKLFDEWEPWVVSKTVRQYDLYRYFQDHYCDKDRNNLISYLSAQAENEGSSLKSNQKMLEEIYENISFNVVEEEYFKLLPESEYKNDHDILSDAFYKWCDINTYEYKNSIYWQSITYPWSESKYRKKNIDWVLTDSCSTSFFAKDIAARCGKFSDYREFVCKSTSVYSSKLIEKEKQHKVYEVIYRIQFGDVDKYALCTLLLQNDGSSEIEIVNKSNNLLDLI